MVRKNPPNGLHFLQFLKPLLVHFSEEGSLPGVPAYLVSLINCITELFRDNFKVLAGLDEKHIELFVDLYALPCCCSRLGPQPVLNNPRGMTLTLDASVRAD